MGSGHIKSVLRCHRRNPISHKTPYERCSYINPFMGDTFNMPLPLTLSINTLREIQQKLPIEFCRVYEMPWHKQSSKHSNQFEVPSNLLYKPHLSRHLHYRLQYVAQRQRDDCTMRRETVKFGIMWLILEILRYMSHTQFARLWARFDLHEKRGTGIILVWAQPMRGGVNI